MGMNIKNPEAHRLAKELAELTGTSVTAAVTEALRQQLVRARAEKRSGSLAERLMEIGRETAPLFKEPYRSIDPDELLYDENGLPK